MNSNERFIEQRVSSQTTGLNRLRRGLLAATLFMAYPGVNFAQVSGPSATRPGDMKSAAGESDMKAARALTTKILAIGTWTAKGTPASRPAIMPAEARDTLRLHLRGKIEQWFAKKDGSGPVFLMNVTDPAEARALLEQLPLGKAGMMTFELIPLGPLFPLGLLLREPEEIGSRIPSSK